MSANDGMVSASYAYYPDGSRRKKTVNVVTTHYVRDITGHVIAEYDGAGALHTLDPERSWIYVPGIEGLGCDHQKEHRFMKNAVTHKIRQMNDNIEQMFELIRHPSTNIVSQYNIRDNIIQIDDGIFLTLIDGCDVNDKEDSFVEIIREHYGCIYFSVFAYDDLFIVSNIEKFSFRLRPNNNLEFPCIHVFDNPYHAIINFDTDIFLFFSGNFNLLKTVRSLSCNYHVNEPPVEYEDLSYRGGIHYALSGISGEIEKISRWPCFN